MIRQFVRQGRRLQSLMCRVSKWENIRGPYGTCVIDTNEEWKAAIHINSDWNAVKAASTC